MVDSQAVDKSNIFIKSRKYGDSGVAIHNVRYYNWELFTRIYNVSHSFSFLWYNALDAMP